MNYNYCCKPYIKSNPLLRKSSWPGLTGSRVDHRLSGAGPGDQSYTGAACPQGLWGLRAHLST